MGQMKLVSSLLTVVLITAELAGAGVADGQTRDYGALTCGNFLASGHDNMAVIFGGCAGTTQARRELIHSTRKMLTRAGWGFSVVVIETRI